MCGQKGPEKRTENVLGVLRPWTGPIDREISVVICGSFQGF
jgi:hypothetical protein